MDNILQKAPDFELNNQFEQAVSLSDYRGKWVLLFFYPKDNTPGCTLEAVAFRDRLSEFQRYDCDILGINSDDVRSHSRFCERHRLGFSLLSDTEKVVSKVYGVCKDFDLLSKRVSWLQRTSFLIDPGGVIQKVYRSVNPVLHASNVLKDLHRLTGA